MTDFVAQLRALAEQARDEHEQMNQGAPSDEYAARQGVHYLLELIAGADDPDTRLEAAKVAANLGRLLDRLHPPYKVEVLRRERQRRQMVNAIAHRRPRGPGQRWRTG